MPNAQKGPHKKRPLRRVVAVFKTHFDLGFTDLPDRVMALYTGPMFDAVMGVMQATADQPPHLQYKWTLPAWPMRYLLHDPAVPEDTRIAARDLVLAGRLFWHAWPFTTHTAFCGLEDLVRGLYISRSLSKEFGVWPRSAKQTDVPGHTWILPSLLVRAGVRFLHLGCNPGSHPPHVPRIFWWEGPDGSRLLTYYSVGGYGTSLLPPEDWELDTWLALQHTVDNIGPQSAQELAIMRAELAEKAPGVELTIGSLDDFADSLFERPEQLEGLPVVPYDLADTWIHGVGTMPREVARVRALRADLLAAETLAALHDWPGRGEQGSVSAKPAPPDFPLSRKIAPAIETAYEQLMLFGEHTWGLDVKSTIRRAYGSMFDAARKTHAYKLLEASWEAKAAYVDRAEEALASAVQAIREETKFHNLDVPKEHDDVATPVRGESNLLENKWLRLRVDPASGGITSLFDKRTQHEWVDPNSPEPFGGYRYDLYSASDIAEFMRAYGLFLQDWFVQDFGKTGYPEDSTHLTSYARNFLLAGKSATQNSQTIHLIGGVLMPETAANMSAPDQQISLDITLYNATPHVDLEYSVIDKIATPLAESAVVAFPLNLPKPSFRLGQVGSVIDPGCDIAAGANRSLWCVDGWADACDDRVGLGVIPIDMPLVSLGSVGIFEFDPNRLPTEPVIYSHLYNTQWGTNFRQWHEGDFRFRIRLVPHAGDWRVARLWETALQTRRSLLLPTSVSHNALSEVLRLSDGLTLLSLHPRHDGPGMIARFWDALGIPRDVSVTAIGPVAALWHCDLMERPIERFDSVPTEEGVSARMRISTHAVETLLIEFTR